MTTKLFRQNYMQHLTFTEAARPKKDRIVLKTTLRHTAQPLLRDQNWTKIIKMGQSSFQNF